MFGVRRSHSEKTIRTLRPFSFVSTKKMIRACRQNRRTRVVIGTHGYLVLFGYVLFDDIGASPESRNYVGGIACSSRSVYFYSHLYLF
ncbi:hypothetical protein HanIR_Chr01g0036241 [Helianthus annuus]|nr:hypothetical protein HanIR_Chr01g0036241 [Helianthus annuus]